jgi:hypothetical protein
VNCIGLSSLITVLDAELSPAELFEAKESTCHPKSLQPLLDKLQVTIPSFSPPNVTWQRQSGAVVKILLTWCSVKIMQKWTFGLEVLCSKLRM